MQVGPAITHNPEEALMLDVKEYAAHPITFLRKHIQDAGAEATREFVERITLYPFLSDLFGEWLRRSVEPQGASSFLSTITREVIGNMTLTELCAMLQAPLDVLSMDGAVDVSVVSGIFRELHLSALAEKIELAGARIKVSDLEGILTQTPKQSQVTESSSNYNEFLSELKEAGVIIPPSAKERQTKVQARRSAALDEPVIPKPPKVKASLQKSAPRTTVGVESMLSPEAREKIMTKIFRDDEDDFRRSIELLDKAKDWKQASIYLDALFMRRKVDPYSKTATRLTDAVYLRFNSVR